MSCPSGHTLDTLKILAAVLGSLLVLILYLLLAWDHFLPERFRGFFYKSMDRLKALQKKKEKLEKKLKNSKELIDDINDKEQVVKNRFNQFQQWMSESIDDQKEQLVFFVPYIKLYITFYQANIYFFSCHVDKNYSN